MSSRSSLIAYLEPLIAATPGLEKIKLVRTVRAVDALSQPTLIVKTDALRKLPAAPMKKILASFTLVLVSPHKDVEKAEDQLDDLLEILLPLLLTWGIVWDSATQTEFDSEHIAYDIAITSILS